MSPPSLELGDDGLLGRERELLERLKHLLGDGSRAGVLAVDWEDAYALKYSLENLARLRIARLLGLAEELKPAPLIPFRSRDHDPPAAA